MLKDLAEMKFDILRDHSSTISNDQNISPSVLSTVGLRRATEARTIKIVNSTGLDFNVSHKLNSEGDSLVFVRNRAEIVLGYLQEGDTLKQDLMSIQLASTSTAIVGERLQLANLKINSLSRSKAFLYLLQPVSAVGIRHRTETDIAYYNAEPVVESCMRNERLRSSVNDVFGLPKGKDLLSSEVWSLEEENQDIGFITESLGKEAMGKGRRGTKTSTRLRGNWVKPYLKSDPSEWSDMTCTLRIARDVSS